MEVGQARVYHIVFLPLLSGSEEDGWVEKLEREKKLRSRNKELNCSFFTFPLSAFNAAVNGAL